MEQVVHRCPASGTLIERMAEQKLRLEAEVACAEAGPARNELMKKLPQLGVAARLNEWLSPRLQSPR